jgi:replicative DNA helicase
MSNVQLEQPTAPRFIDLYVEKALLGHILLDHQVPEALRFLEPADFCDPLNRAIYVAACAVQAQGARVDSARLMDQMRRDRTRNDLELVGGLFYLYECMDLYPALGKGPVYARRLLDLASKRKV